MEDPAGDSQLAATARAAATQPGTRGARLTAGFIAASSSLAAGTWIAALLAVTIEPSGGGERALIGVVAGAAIAGVALLHIKALRPAWHSAADVVQCIGPAARALVAGMLTFGALELVTMASLAVFGVPPLGAVARVAVAGLAAGLGLLWQWLGMDDRLRRRVG